jgi:hypothetical protein
MYRDTKNELFNLFGNSFDKQYLETPDQKELEEYQFNLRQFDALEDITKQTIAIAKSPNPNLFARSIENLFGSKTNENYSFLLNAILKNNLAMLKQVATLSDPTMYFTEKSLGFASTIPFILLSNLETEQRNRFVAESGRLLGSYYINIVNGNKISPVIVPYAASAIFLPSTPVGWLYSAADVIDWSVEYYKSIKEWDSLVINSEEIKEDPCTPPNIIETNSLQCSPEKRTKLLEEFRYYEKENE